MTDYLCVSDAKFAQLINPLPNEFVQAGLVFEKRSIASSPLGPSANYRFENKETGIALEIGIGQHGVDLVLVSNTNKKDSFFLEYYLKRHGQENEATKFFYLSKDPEAALAYIRKLIATDWLDIFHGKRWEHIPYDLHGLK